MQEYDEAVLALNRYIQENHLQILGGTYKITYEDGTVEVKIPNTCSSNGKAVITPTAATSRIGMFLQRA